MNIDFPFHLSERGRTATTGDANHIRDMIEALLFTSPGERVNRPEFGSGLLQMIFASNSTELVAAPLQYTTQAALQQWLGDVIEVRELAVECDEAMLRVTLSYAIQRTGEERTDIFVRRGV
jgi:phage baseplate assembly protein W